MNPTEAEQRLRLRQREDLTKAVRDARTYFDFGLDALVSHGCAAALTQEDCHEILDDVFRHAQWELERRAVPTVQGELERIVNERTAAPLQRTPAKEKYTQAKPVPGAASGRSGPGERKFELDIATARRSTPMPIPGTATRTSLTVPGPNVDIVAATKNAWKDTVGARHRATEELRASSTAQKRKPGFELGRSRKERRITTTNPKEAQLSVEARKSTIPPFEPMESRTHRQQLFESRYGRTEITDRDSKRAETYTQLLKNCQGVAGRPGTAALLEAAHDAVTNDRDDDLDKLADIVNRARKAGELDCRSLLLRYRQGQMKGATDGERKGRLDHGMHEKLSGVGHLDAAVIKSGRRTV